MSSGGNDPKAGPLEVTVNRERWPTLQSNASPETTEERLRETTEKLGLAMESAREGLWEWDLVSGEIALNPAAMEMLGYEPSVLLRPVDWWMEHFHPDDRDELQEGMNAYVRGERPDYQAEFRIARSDGEYIWVSSSARIIRRDETGNPLYVVGIHRNITERKQREDALRQSEELLNEAQEVADMGSFVWDLKSDLVTCSRNMYAIAGLDPERPATMPRSEVLNLVHPQDRSRIRDEFGAMLDARETWPLEYRMVRPDGEERLIRIGSRFIFGEDGVPETCLGVQFDITDQRRTEREAHKNAIFLKEVGEMARVGGWEVDLASNLVHWTATTKHLHEVPEDYVPQVDTAIDFYVPEDRPVISEAVHQARDKGIPYDLTARLVTAQGRRIWVHVIGKPVFDGGTCVRLYGTIQDITENREAELARKASEERLRRAQAVAHVGSWEFNLTTGSVYASEEARRIYGLEDKEWRIPEVQKLPLAEYRPMLDRALQNLLDGSQPYDVEFKIRRPSDGRLVDIHSIAEYDAEKHLIVGTIQDITERKRAEEKLRRSEEKYRSYIDNAPDGIFIADQHGRYVDVNAAACSLSGYSREDLLGMSVEDIVSPDDPEIGLRHFQQVRKTGSSGGESPIRRKDGTMVWWSIDAARLSDDRYICFCQDVTETRRLRAMESRAQRLETAGRIAGQVAHDFNNMLGPLVAYPDLLRDEVSGNSVALELIDAMEESARRMSEVNQQLLTLGRRAHYNLEPLNLNDVVREVVRELSSLPEELVIDTELDSGLMNIMGGRAQLHRVMTNLLQNSIDATRPAGTVSVRTENIYVDDENISYGRVPRGEYVKLSIVDTGCGIPEDVIESVFDPFFTTKSADKKRGSGLGLSVVNGVVRDHSGYIDLSTRIGKGTTFSIYLPVTRQSVDDFVEEAVVGGDESVLVVDDDQMQREVSARLLAKLGYAVETADSGEAAVERLRQSAVDVLVLDMVMPPGIDGAETYRRITAIRPGQRAVIVSGYSESDRVRETQRLGAGAYVRKPITYRELASAVRGELDRVPVA
ncbi:PAS domain S-box protein [candidate division GN15 bacterium]|nr:PAS domain S-box protein [candidate division GN15 bacterium]